MVWHILPPQVSSFFLFLFNTSVFFFLLFFFSTRLVNVMVHASSSSEQSLSKKKRLHPVLQHAPHMLCSYSLSGRGTRSRKPMQRKN